jgi:hypothetical protein
MEVPAQPQQLRFGQGGNSMSAGTGGQTPHASVPIAAPAAADDNIGVPDRASAHAVTMELPDLPTLISIPRAAAVLGISRASAYRYAACGDLPTIRLGGRLYIVTARLRAFLEVA